MNEKQKLEKAALNYFLPIYNKLYSTHLKFQKHSDKPDTIVRDSKTGRVAGIEITHLYYDSREAKMLLNRPNQPKYHGEMISTKLIENLNKLIDKKIKDADKYSFSNNMFLIIRVVSPIFDKSDFDRFDEDIIIPDSRFKEIWLILYDFTKQKWGELKLLYKNPT